MKKQMSYKAKRSMIILAVIVILAIIASIGTYAFISGNDETQAMSQTNGTASDRAGQEVEQAQEDNNQGTAVQSDNNQSEEQQNDNDGQAEQIDVADATDDNNNDGTTTSTNNQGTDNTGNDDGTTTTSTATNINTNNANTDTTTPTTQTVTTTEQVERTETLVGFRTVRLASSLPTALTATFPQVTTPEEPTEEDTTAPGTGNGFDGFPLYILNVSANNEEDIDKYPSHYQYIQDKDTLRVEANFNEELDPNTLPLLTIIGNNGKTITKYFDNHGKSGEKYSYVCDIDNFSSSELQLNNNDRIEFTITNVKDLAGNTAEFSNNNVTQYYRNGVLVYDQVRYDETAPEYYSLEILNITHYEENKEIKKENEKIENEADKKELKDLKVATTGDRIRVLISFNEELAVEPQLIINGEGCGTIPYSVPTSSSMERPYYLVDFTISEETDIENHKIKLDEGKVNIEVYGYEDAAGNVGRTLKNTDEQNDIKNTNYTEVTYDVTPPVHYSLEILNNTHYNENYTITDESQKKDLKYATTNDQIRIRVSFKEKLSVAPKLKVGDKVISWGLPFSQPSTDASGRYYYLTDIDLTEDMLEGMNLVDGAPIPIEVYDYEDAAGNVGETITNIGEESGIQNTEYTEVIYDVTAPTRRSADFYVNEKQAEQGGTLIIKADENKKEQYQFAKNGDTIVMNAKFYEELANIPTFFLVDSKGNEINLNKNGTVVYRGYEEKDQIYLYQASYTIPKDESELPEGEMTIKITNIIDKVGLGEGYTITEPSNGRMIYYDRTNPELTVKEDEDLTIGYKSNYSKISFKLHDNIAIKDLEINGEVVRTISDKIVTLSDANFEGFVEGYLKQGENTVVLRDWAGNETEPYTFYFDNTPAKLSAFNLLVLGDDNNDEVFHAKIGDTIQTYVSFDEKLADEPIFYLIDEEGKHLDVSELVTEEGPTKEGKYIYQVLYKVNGNTELVDGEIKVRVTGLEDMYGNKIPDETEPSNHHDLYLDTEVPGTGERGFPLYILNHRADGDNRPYTLVRDGEEIMVEANFTEELAHNPNISLIRNDDRSMTEPVELPYSEKINDKYVYRLVMKINANDLQLENGDMIEFVITDVEDFAGNTATFDNSYVTSIKLDDGREYGQVTYDNKVPECKVLRVHNDTHYNNGGDLNVATNGDSIRFGVQFDEELAVLPTLVIEGNGPEETRTFTMKKSDIDLEYIADVKLTSEMELPQGDIKFKIYGYEDLAGNSIGVDNALTEANINHTKYNGVKYDTIAPEYQTLGILNTTNMNENEDITVAKDGDNVRVLVWFKEKLAVEPKISILNKDGNYVELESGCKYSNDDREDVHYYIANFKLTPEMNLPQGEIKFKIYGFEDTAGNTVSEENALTNDNINRTDYTKVIYDSITPDNTVYIGTEESLLQLAKDINSGTSFAGKTIKLTSDITFTEQEWTPIYAGNLNGKGSMLEGATIDGQGFAIKGLKSSRDAYVPNASIETPYGNGFISENAGALTIKNIIFYNTTIIDPTAKDISATDPDDKDGYNDYYAQHYVGTVIGHNTIPRFDENGNKNDDKLVIENVTVKNSHLENSWQCGGLVGYSSSGITFKNCSISDSFIGGPNATSGTLFGLGVVDITVENCRSYDVRLYTDSLTWGTTAKQEGNFWVGHLYHNSYNKDTKLTVTNSSETNVTVVDTIE